MPDGRLPSTDHVNSHVLSLKSKSILRDRRPSVSVADLGGNTRLRSSVPVIHDVDSDLRDSSDYE